jgi:hypothetical protein
MAGLINVGADYQNRALSGFIRESAEQSEIDATNEQLKSAKKAQKTSTTVSATTTGAMVGGYVAAGTSVGGPYGAVIGAGLGFLFSQLF